MSELRLKNGARGMGKIYPPCYFAVSLTVGCLDALIFSYWLRKYLPSPVKALSEWGRLYRKIAGSFIIWAIKEERTRPVITWIMRLTRTSMLRSDAEAKSGSKSGINSGAISMSG